MVGPWNIMIYRRGDFVGGSCYHRNRDGAFTEVVAEEEFFDGWGRAHVIAEDGGVI